MGLYRYNGKLEIYLNKWEQIPNRPVREMSKEETDLFADLTAVHKSFGVLATELICIISILEHMDNTKMDYVVSNIRRITNSIVKQRKKIRIVRNALSTLKPDEKELEEVLYFKKASERREEFLRNTALPDNLELTPIQDYLQILGKETLKDDLFDRYKTVPAIVALNNGENPEGLDQYVNEILSTVREAGKMDGYEARIDEYIRIADTRRKKRDEENAERKLQENLKIAQDEMLNFQRRFNNVSFTWKGDKKIRMGWQTIKRQIDKYGRNVFVILCCYVGNGRTVCRYIGGNRNFYPGFGSAHIYGTEEEACEDMKILQQEYPDRVFDVVELSHVEPIYS